VDARVEQEHRIVVKLAPVGDFIFNLGNARLQLEEVCIRLEPRVVLGNCKQGFYGA